MTPLTQSEAEARELLDCPFCGEPTSCARVKNDPWQGGCSNNACPVQPHIDDAQRTVLIARWNTRAALSPQDSSGDARELVAELLNPWRQSKEERGPLPNWAGDLMARAAAALSPQDRPEGAGELLKLVDELDAAARREWSRHYDADFAYKADTQDFYSNLNRATAQDAKALAEKLERQAKALRAALVSQHPPVPTYDSEISDEYLDALERRVDAGKPEGFKLTPIPAPVDEAAVELVEKLKPALELLPITTHDTPDYAEATGPQFQAMTMKPEAFLALNHLPDAIAALTASPPSSDRLTIPDQPEQIEQIISAWAFAHNIDGAARNDLFKRLRQAPSDQEPRR